MEYKMKKYIVDYIITPEITKQAAQELTFQIGNQIKDQGAVNKTWPLKKTKLAYLIKGQQVGFLNRIEFSCQKKDLNKITEQIKQKPEVLRILVAQKAKRKLKQRKPLKISEPKAERKVDLDKIEEELNKLME